MLLVKLESSGATQAASPSQSSSGFGSFDQVLGKIFNALQLNPEELTAVGGSPQGGENSAASEGGNTLLALLDQLLGQSVGQGLTDEDLQSLLDQLGIEVTDQGLMVAEDSPRLDDVQALATFLGLDLQATDGGFVLTQAGAAISQDELAALLKQKQAALMEQQALVRQASYGETQLQAPRAGAAGAGEEPPAGGASSSALTSTEDLVSDSDDAALATLIEDDAAEAAGQEDDTTPAELERLRRLALNMARQGGPKPDAEASTQKGLQANLQNLRHVADPGATQPQAAAASPENLKAELSVMSNEAYREGGSTFLAEGNRDSAMKSAADLRLLQASGLAPEPAALLGSAQGSAGQDAGTQGQPWTAFHQSVLLSRGDATAAADAEAPVPQSRGELGRDLIHQIVDKARLQNGRHESKLEIQLKPEFLGRVRIEISSREGQVSVNIHTENQSVKNLLDSNLPALRDAFQAQGLKLEGLEVSVDQRDWNQTSAFAQDAAGGHGEGRRLSEGRGEAAGGWNGESDGAATEGADTGVTASSDQKLDLFA
ncbi:MAG: flagellar hook-length control protein FliK [Nitrospirae bacterium]|nr:flagellar hook-length control protein FliK [Nitrospirota bacterium]